MEPEMIGVESAPGTVRNAGRKARGKSSRTAGGTGAEKRKTSIVLSADAEEQLHRFASLKRRSASAVVEDLVREHVPRCSVRWLSSGAEEHVPAVA